jgi:uncharacterized protein (DUF2384 family)
VQAHALDAPHAQGQHCPFVLEPAELALDRAIRMAIWSTARAWLAHTRSPTGERAERLIELSALVERLARVMEPSYIAVWLRKPVPALEERKPIDVIASGDYMRVAELISALEEASFS